jgi:SAM-dependent methyltransferase
MTAQPQKRDDQALLDVNRGFYDALWARSRLMPANRFNTWPLVESLLAAAPARLEVAPGLRPRLPIEGTTFVDVSEPAIAKLRECGADARLGLVSRLPLPDSAFDLVAALDIVEHVDDDDAALRELTRVSKPGGALLLSAPLHAGRWTSFDDFVGHRRRYEPGALLAKLAQLGWSVRSSAIYGMQPSSSSILDWSVRQLREKPDRAIWIYDRILMPIASFFQKRLDLVPGMLDAANVDEVLLVCRREEPAR